MNTFYRHCTVQACTLYGIFFSVLSGTTYLTVIGTVQIVGHGWILCCQGVNLRRKLREYGIN